MLGYEELVPVALIKESTPDLIFLRCQLHELVDLEPFNYLILCSVLITTTLNSFSAAGDEI